jgi:hypothetical protein
VLPFRYTHPRANPFVHPASQPLSAVNAAIYTTLKLVEKSNVPFHSWKFAERKNASLDAAKRGRRCNYRQAESERFGLKLTCPDAWVQTVTACRPEPAIEAAMYRDKRIAWYV